MESELEGYLKTNTDQELQLQEQKQKLRVLDGDLRLERQKTFDFTVVLNRYRADLQACLEHLQYPDRLKEAIKALYSKHVSSEVQPEKLLVDDSSLEEFQRQRDFLERTVTSLRHKLTKDTHLQKVDNVRVVQENIALISELNKMREELHVARSQLTDLETALGLKRTTVTPAEAQAKLEMVLKQREQLEEEHAEQIKARDATIGRQQKQVQQLSSRVQQLTWEVEGYKRTKPC